MKTRYGFLLNCLHDFLPFFIQFMRCARKYSKQICHNYRSFLSTGDCLTAGVPTLPTLLEGAVPELIPAFWRLVCPLLLSTVASLVPL